MDVLDGIDGKESAGRQAAVAPVLKICECIVKPTPAAYYTRALPSRNGTAEDGV